MTAIRMAESDEEIAHCFPVMQQLRPHLAAHEFVPTVSRQQLGGYRLAYLEDKAQVCAVAGFRGVAVWISTQGCSASTPIGSIWPTG